MAQITFNAGDHKMPEFDPIPPGVYLATIVGSDLVASKSENAGEMFRIEFEIDGNEHPKFAGRKITNHFCINHASTKTAEIARGQLAKVLMVSETPTIEDTSDLLGKQLRIRLKMGKATEGYEARAEYADCRSATAPDPKQPTPKPTEQAAPASNGTAAPSKNGTAKKGWR